MICRPSGPTNKPLLALVGDFPQVEDERSGKPFTGSNGFILDQMLRSAGIDRHECFITNVSNIRPLGNDFGMFYEDPKKRTIVTSELCDQRQRLWSELKTVQPKVVVAFGPEALNSLCQETSIGNYRGTLIERNGYRVLPTFHPSHVLRSYTDRVVVETDLKKAIRQARNPYTPRPILRIKPSFDEAMQFLESRPEYEAFDIETIGQMTRCLGFATSGLDAISIPLIWKGTHYWTEHEESLIFQSLKAHLACPDIKKFIQNFPFDATVIAKELGLHIEGLDLDTMIAHHLLYPELPKGLDFLSSIYTDFPMYWGDDRFGSDENTAIYNCYDCCATFEAAIKIKHELDERGLMSFYRSPLQPTMLALTRMQSRGFQTCNETREKLRAENLKKLEDIKAQLATTLGFELNPNSPKQVKELVYEKWKLPVVKDFKTKKPTTDDDALKTLAKKFPQHAPVLFGLIAFRQTKKLISTYIDMTVDSTGRIHTSFNVAGTVTGRVSSSQTYDGQGGNLTNIPRGSFRRMFIPTKGKVLIKADLSQADFRVVIWLAKAWKIIQKYTDNPNFDVHTWNAGENIHRIPLDQVTKSQRTEAKASVHGANYGIGPLKTARMYNIDANRAKENNARYHAAIPEIRAWWRIVQEKLGTTRSLCNPMGRQRVFLGRLDEDTYRAAYGWLGQSTVADVISSAIARLDQAGVDLVVQVHDEIVSECEPHDVPRVVSLVRSAMEIPIVVEGVDTPLVIPAEISVGPNWYDTIPYEEWLKQNAGQLSS